jgi:hypothetical protein
MIGSPKFTTMSEGGVLWSWVLAVSGIASESARAAATTGIVRRVLIRGSF